ncbi:hypothetical protein FYK55_06965 [Roseiconus nitratireducens]|uniref:Uncharacterized protein n=1 Tax=Roseiconus nitratireducens TaxID=2605748 RepID=A0A5M6DJC2_9BACT|nr:hypothetical protein [Roseiconus nitratireducens]KAA5545385.1 hypothetical protein FYK55_06965 [Roseiconus nitratireducens]
MKTTAGLAHESSEATRRIRAALDDKTSQSFIQTPLVDAIQLLSTTHDIPIVVDTVALEESGISLSTPIILDLKNVSLRSFLRIMLRRAGLSYVIKNEVLQITTAEEADKYRVVEMYPFPEALTEKSSEVIKALTSSVEPNIWAVNGGDSSATAVENVLVVSASESTHEHVADFLEKLQRAFEQR